MTYHQINMYINRNIQTVLHLDMYTGHCVNEISVNMCVCVNKIRQTECLYFTMTDKSTNMFSAVHVIKYLHGSVSGVICELKR